jgi:hypothetical protein
MTETPTIAMWRAGVCAAMAGVARSTGASDRMFLISYFMSQPTIGGGQAPLAFDFSIGPPFAGREQGAS